MKYCRRSCQDIFQSIRQGYAVAYVNFSKVSSRFALSLKLHNASRVCGVASAAGRGQTSIAVSTSNGVAKIVRPADAHPHRLRSPPIKRFGIASGVRCFDFKLGRHQLIQWSSRVNFSLGRRVKTFQKSSQASHRSLMAPYTVSFS